MTYPSAATRQQQQQDNPYTRSKDLVPQELYEAIASHTIEVKDNGIHVTLSKVKVWPGFTSKQEIAYADVQYEYAHPTIIENGYKKVYSFRQRHFAPKSAKVLCRACRETLDPTAPQGEFFLRDDFLMYCHMQVCTVFLDPEDIVASKGSDGRIYCEVSRDDYIGTQPPGTSWVVEMGTGIGMPPEDARHPLPQDDQPGAAPVPQQEAAQVDPNDAFLPD